MTKLLDAKIQWNEEFSNSADFYLLVDKEPDYSALRYDYKDGCYLAINEDGFASFFAYDKPGDGYGGSVFHITMKDGSEKDLIGPWSSRSGVMNNVFGVQLSEVGITTDKNMFYNRRGGCYIASSITLDLLIEACKILGVGLAKVDHYGEFYYQPTVNGKTKCLAANENGRYEKFVETILPDPVDQSIHRYKVTREGLKDIIMYAKTLDEATAKFRSNSLLNYKKGIKAKIEFME